MNLNDALDKLAKWRTVFAGWQLGTRTKEDPECAAVRDHREATILLRAEVNTLTALMIEKGVFNSSEFSHALSKEAQQLDKDYERKFPGVTTSLGGVSISREAVSWMKGWRP